jgi:hypothetical protein
MNPAAVQKGPFKARTGAPGQENRAVYNDSNVAGLFDGSTNSLNGAPAWRVRMPAGATPEVATARKMLRGKFNCHMALPAIDRATEFGNLLVSSINALVNSSVRDRFSFSLKLCSACIVNSQQASTLAFVISEILINALQYAHPMGGRIAIKIACAPDRDGNTTIDICDDGVGLPLDFAEWIDAKGIMLIRFNLQKVGACMDLESDDLGLSYRIVLPPSISQNAIYYARQLNS